MKTKADIDNPLLRGNITIDGNIVPDKHLKYNLGSENKKFNELFLSGNTIHLGNCNIKNVDKGIVLKNNKNKRVPLNNPIIKTPNINGKLLLNKVDLESSITAINEHLLIVEDSVSIIIDMAPENLDTLHELATTLQNNPSIIFELQQSDSNINSSILSIQSSVSTLESSINDYNNYLESSIYTLEDSINTRTTSLETSVSTVEDSINTRTNNLETSVSTVEDSINTRTTNLETSVSTVEDLSLIHI